MPTYSNKDIFIAQRDSTNTSFVETVLSVVPNSYLYLDSGSNLLATTQIYLTSSQAVSSSYAKTASFALNVPILTDSASYLNPGANIYLDNSFIYSNTSASAPIDQIEGQIWWDKVSHTYVIDELNSRLQIGQENYIRAIGGEFIPNGKAVYINGADTDPDDPTTKLPVVFLAIADGTGTKNKVIGISIQDISIGQRGFVTTQGIVNDLDTGMFFDGDVLYLSSINSGSLENTIPVYPGEKIKIGTNLYSSISSGRILVDLRQIGSVSNAVTASYALLSERTNIADGGGPNDVFDTGSFISGSFVSASYAVMTSYSISASYLNPFAVSGSSITRSLNDRFTDVVNIKDFGAKGDVTGSAFNDPSNDSTLAIQAAIDYARPLGKSVFIPAGNYVVNTLRVDGITLNFDTVGSTARMFSPSAIFWHKIGATDDMLTARTMSLGKPTINGGTFYGRPEQNRKSGYTILDATTSSFTITPTEATTVSASLSQADNGVSSFPYYGFVSFFNSDSFIPRYIGQGLVQTIDTSTGVCSLHDTYKQQWFGLSGSDLIGGKVVFSETSQETGWLAGPKRVDPTRMGYCGIDIQGAGTVTTLRNCNFRNFHVGIRFGLALYLTLDNVVVGNCHFASIAQAYPGFGSDIYADNSTFFFGNYTTDQSYPIGDGTVQYITDETWISSSLTGSEYRLCRNGIYGLPSNSEFQNLILNNFVYPIWLQNSVQSVIHSSTIDGFVKNSINLYNNNNITFNNISIRGAMGVVQQLLLDEPVIEVGNTSKLFINNMRLEHLPNTYTLGYGVNGTYVTKSYALHITDTDGMVWTNDTTKTPCYNTLYTPTSKRIIVLDSIVPLDYASTSSFFGIGTANYIPKWNSGNTLNSSSLIYDTGTRIGISIPFPSKTLDVSGSFNVSDVSTIGNISASDAQLTVKGGQFGSDILQLQRSIGASIIYGLSLSNEGLIVRNINRNVSPLTIYTPAPTYNPHLMLGYLAGSGTVTGSDGYIHAEDADTGAANLKGGDLYIMSGQGCGSATASNIYFKTPDVGSSGSVAQVSSTKMTIYGNGHISCSIITASAFRGTIGNSTATTGSAYFNNTGMFIYDTGTAAFRQLKCDSGVLSVI